MAITAQALQLLRRLRVNVGETADAATRDLTKAWVTAWDELHTQASAAVNELVTAAATAGRWPQPWELARMYRLQETLAAAEQALAHLGTQTGVTVTDAAGQVIAATVDQEPRLIASQLPAAEQVAAARRFASRIVPQVVQVMVARTQARIVSTARPLSADAMDAMRRELVVGVAVGDNPRTSARNMLDRVEGAFNGGLTRAMNIARTEVLDAYRAASAQVHAANADVLSGWIWLSALDRRTCPSCWSKHGTEYPVTTPGPWDHQQGRCARMPKVRPWSDLGIHIPEPASTLPDAQSRFWSLPAADRMAIMGPARLELLRTGQVDWPDLAVRRTSTGWRDSVGPRSVGDLNRIAGQRRAAGIAPNPHPLTPAEPTRVRPAQATKLAPAPKQPTTPSATTVLRATVKDINAATKAGTGVERIRLSGGQSAETSLVKLDDGRRAVYKRAPEWGDPDAPRTQAHAEVLASRVAQALGVDAPPAVMAGRDAVWMGYVPGKTAGQILDMARDAAERAEYEALLDGLQGKRMGLLDALIGNSDRNDGNMIVSGGRLAGIDHGFSWELLSGRAEANELGGNITTRPLRHFIGERDRDNVWIANPLTAEDVAETRRRLEDLRPEFARLGREHWLDRSLGQLDELAKHATGTVSIYGQ